MRGGRAPPGGSSVNNAIVSQRKTTVDQAAETLNEDTHCTQRTEVKRVSGREAEKRMLASEWELKYGVHRTHSYISLYCLYRTGTRRRGTRHGAELIADSLRKSVTEPVPLEA